MKIDVSVNKKATINTGNYSSISPSISITIKDIDTSKLEDLQEDINSVTSALFLNEMYLLSEIQNSVKIAGIRQFFEDLDIGEMKKDFAESLKKLSSIDWAI